MHAMVSLFWNSCEIYINTHTPTSFLHLHQIKNQDYWIKVWSIKHSHNRWTIFGLFTSTIFGLFVWMLIIWTEGLNFTKFLKEMVNGLKTLNYCETYRKRWLQMLVSPPSLSSSTVPLKYSQSSQNSYQSFPTVSCRKFRKFSMLWTWR